MNDNQPETAPTEEEVRALLQRLRDEKPLARLVADVLEELLASSERPMGEPTDGVIDLEQERRLRMVKRVRMLVEEWFDIRLGGR